MSPNGQSAELRRQIPSLKALPRPVYARAESLARGSWTPWHSHPWAQLSYAIKGVLSVHTRAGSFVAPPQRAVWIPAGLEHEVRSSAEAEMRSLYLGPQLLPNRGAECRVLSVSLLLRELIRTFTTFPVEYDEEGSEGRLVEVLIDQLAIAPHMALSLPLPADARLRRLCEHLQQAPDDQRTLAEWALLLGASEKTLSRHFQRETGLTFRAWRQKLRLLSALTRLERGDSVTAVALSCGYDSPSAFIAAFRAQFGTTPGDFFTL